MKTYEEYYDECKTLQDESIKVSESMYGKGWWKKNVKYLKTSNNYDFIKPINDKNNAPIAKNLTNVYNSEWCILHHIISNMVIDYIKDNNIKDNVYSYSININLDKPKKKWSIYLKTSDNESIDLPDSEPYDFPSFDFIADEKIISKFNKLNAKIYEYFNLFLKNNSDDIPEIINNLNFAIDNIVFSVENGKWMSSSDSSLSIGWDKNGDSFSDELLVVSM